jgi:uncharacterized Fe-S radical SAM superfamily protein PflX
MNCCEHACVINSQAAAAGACKVLVWLEDSVANSQLLQYARNKQFRQLNGQTVFHSQAAGCNVRQACYIINSKP